MSYTFIVYKMRSLSSSERKEVVDNMKRLINLLLMVVTLNCELAGLKLRILANRELEVYYCGECCHFLEKSNAVIVIRNVVVLRKYGVL